LTKFKGQKWGFQLVFDTCLSFLLIRMKGDYGVKRHFQQYFNYIVAVSLIG